MTKRYGLKSVTDLNRHLGEKIRIERNKKKITQEKLSELAGLSQNFISQLESGRKTPSLFTILKISRALSITLSRLLSEV